MFWRVTKEFFIAMFWVFLILIVGYFILDFLINRNVPFLGSASSWIEQRTHA